MKKTIFPALVSLALYFPANSQQINQAFIVKGMHLTSVLHDSKGFLYAFGTEMPELYHSYIPFNGNELPTYFKIRKYDPVNGSMIWERSMFSAKILAITTPRIVNDEIFLAGYFRDTLSGDFGPAFSNGNNDFLFAKLDENGLAQMITSGGPGDELLDCLLPDGAGNFYISGRVNGNVKIPSLSATTYTEQHSFLCHAGFTFSSVNWIRYAKAAPNGSNWGLASFFYLDKMDNFLYSRTHGKSNMLDTNCTFGSGDYTNDSEKWNLQGRLIGRVPVGSTYSSHSFLLATEQPGNYYIAYNTHNKGPTGVGIKKYNEKGDSIIFQNFFEDHSFLYDALGRGDKYILATFGSVGTGKNYGHCLIEGDIETGTVRRIYSFEYPDGGPMPYKIGNYLNNDIIIFGEMPSQMNFGTYTLTGGDASIKQDYIALLSWPTLTGISETAEKKLNFNIAPNPGFQDFKITFSEDISHAMIRVSDIRGQLIYHTDIRETNQLQLHLPQLQAGIYFLEMESGAHKVVRKLICSVH